MKNESIEGIKSTGIWNWFENKKPIEKRILDEAIEDLRTHVDKNNIKDFVVCIGNKAFFNVK